MTKLKLAGNVVVCMFLVAIGFALGHKPPRPPTVVERVVYQDRIVEKQVLIDKTKTTKLPDGTLIVETDKSLVASKDASHKSEAVKAATVSSLLPQYSLGVSAVFNPRAPLEREYQIETSKRLWKTPFSGTLTYQTNRTVSLGVRVDW